MRCLGLFSALARAGEFRQLGRERHAGPVMNQRLQLLTEVVAEAQRRSAAGDALWQRLDWRRLAVAGFDLGAYHRVGAGG